MNTAGKILAGLGLILASSMGYFTLDYLEFSHKKDTFCNLQVKDLSNGDLIFRRGRSVESYAVYITDEHKGFSHVGIICFENGDPFVIHAVPGENGEEPAYIKKEKIVDFLNSKKVSHYAIFRPGFPVAINKSAAMNALQFYYKKLTFDNQYDLNTDDKLYCTELVIKAFRKTNFNIGEFPVTELNFGFEKKRLFLPGNILENQHFIKIINQ
jgi:hypothetical protein